MASMAARAARNQEARERLDDALRRVGKRLDIAVPEVARRMRDAELQPIVEIERFAEFVEAVDAALEALAETDQAPGGYETWTAAMLRDEIAQRGIDAKASRKDDLVAILMENDEAPE